MPSNEIAVVKKESKVKLKSRTKQIIARLRKEYPDPRIALDFSNPLELLVAVILSAQCTDERVNIVTKELFRKYRSAADYARANQAELEQDIRSTGFFRNKAKNIIACCKMIVEKHGGSVPQSLEELVELAGVGRKTAHCVMGGAYGISTGVIVDTHVKRLSERLGLSKQAAPEKIEQDLMEIVPHKDWYQFSNMLIWHGRKVCIARKPNCPACTINNLCPSAVQFVKKFWR